MRTDSNSILSLPSGVPPKKPVFTKSPSSNGADFASDFNKAREAVSSKKASNAETSSTSSAASPSTTSNKVADKSSTSVSAKEKGSVSKLESADSSLTTEKSNTAVSDSGNALQQEGEGLPVEDSSVAVDASDGEGKASSIALSAELDGSSVEPSNQLNSTDSQEIAFPRDAVNIPVSSHNTLAKGSDAVDLPTGEESAEALSGVILSEGAALSGGATVSGDATVEGGVVGLSSIKRSGSSDIVENTTPSTLVALSGKASAESIDPFTHEIADGEESELSWVLSQMGGAGMKGATAKPGGNVALDAAKTTVAAGVIAATLDKQGRSEALPSALLASGETSLSGDVDLDSAESLLSEDGILINEPIELRKKEHEAMLSRMTAQIDGALGDDSSSGGLNSSLHNNVNRPAAAAALNASMSNPQANNLAMSLPPGHPGWANEMTQKVAWIARDGGHTAHIRLDPPELGSLTVKVSVDSDSNTQISFVAATPQARDLLEGQMGRLREMLAQQGMDLSRADVDVSQQDTSGAQDRANNRNGGSSQGGIAGNDDIDEEPIQGNLSYVSASGVDYYA